MAALCMNPGDTLPNLAVETDLGKAQLHDWRGQALVLYFYPKDDTPGCTKQFCSYRDDSEQMESLGATVVGISGQDLDSHEKFIAKHGLTVPVLADAGHLAADV
ncbi:MAG: peroxiredoxin, partial [Burkholderiaceae bacterium]